MAEIVYAAEMRGSGAPVEGQEGVMRAATSGKGPNAVDIIFESEVAMSEDGFTESFNGKLRDEFFKGGAMTRCRTRGS